MQQQATSDSVCADLLSSAQTESLAQFASVGDRKVQDDKMTRWQETMLR